jgi:hypothetical protein
VDVPLYLLVLSTKHFSPENFFTQHSTERLRNAAHPTLAAER